jgi:hypothetical protein
VLRRSETGFSIDSIITIYGEELFDIDLDLRNRLEEAFDLDTIILLYTENPLDVDAIVMKRLETSADIDVILFKTSIQENFDVDTQIQKLGIEKVFDIDIFPYNYSFEHFDIDVRIVRNYGQYIKGIMRFKNPRGKLEFL